MEISSALSKLQAATVTTKALNAQQVQHSQKADPAKDAKAEAKEAVAAQKKNQEINDKADISKEALELLKNCSENTAKDTAEKSDLSALVNKSISAKTYAYKHALKSYSAVKS